MFSFWLRVALDVPSGSPVVLGGSCRDGDVCAAANTLCTNGTCSCEAGYEEDGGKTCGERNGSPLNNSIDAR